MARLDEIAAAIESFIRVRFQVSPTDTGFTRQAHLWEAGYIDSMGVVELIQHLETTFDVMIPADVLFAPEFATVDGIAACVASLELPSSDSVRAAG